MNVTTQELPRCAQRERQRGPSPAWLLSCKAMKLQMNRGGLAGSAFELDDRYTAYDARSIVAMGLDGGKMLVRIAPEDAATVRTLEHSARAVSELAASGLMALVEPFISRWEDGSARSGSACITYRISIFASSRFPNLRAPTGQASWQAG